MIKDYKNIKVSAEYAETLIQTSNMYKKQNFICQIIQIIYFSQIVLIWEQCLRYKCYNIFKGYVALSTETIKYF